VERKPAWKWQITSLCARLRSKDCVDAYSRRSGPYLSGGAADGVLWPTGVGRGFTGSGVANGLLSPLLCCNGSTAHISLQHQYWHWNKVKFYLIILLWYFQVHKANEIPVLVLVRQFGSVGNMVQGSHYGQKIKFDNCSRTFKFCWH